LNKDEKEAIYFSRYELFNESDIEDFLQESVRNTNTRSSYKRALNVLLSTIPKESSIDPACAYKYSIYLGTIYSSSSVRQHISTINSYLVYYGNKYKKITPYFEYRRV